MRGRTTFVLVLALAAAAIFAQDAGQGGRRKQLVSKNFTREFTEQFLMTMVKSRPIDAFALIKTVTPESETDIETTRSSTEQLLDNVRPSYGRIIGYELLETKALGNSFVRYEYLLKFERNALHCRFLYYNNTPTGQQGENWIPVGIWFDGNLGDLFDNIGK